MTGRQSKAMGRQLDEAGSVQREHPGAAAERPEKWERDTKPSVADLSQAGKHEAVRSEELGRLESAGMRDVKAFLTNTASEQLLDGYKQKAPRARVMEQDGVKFLSVPVTEGTMVVTTTEVEGKTLVCELVVPNRVGFEAAEWVQTFQEETRSKME